MKKLSFIILTLIAGSPLLAQNWTGAVNSDWNNAANWSSAPSNGDDVEIDPANYTGAMASPVITVASNFSPAEMLIQNGAHLTISANLSASDRVEVLGEGTIVTITAGTFALTGGGNNGRLIFAEDAHLQMEGGNLTSTQRLLFELGASGEVNAGTITVGETIALVDGSANASSKLVQNGGTIITNGEFGFENEAGEYFPAFEQTGGELHVNGTMLWLGAVPGSGRGYVRSTGGTIFVTGAIGNDPASTMGMQIELSGNTALLQNSGTSVDALAGDSIIVKNGAQWVETNTVTWQNEGIFHAAGDGLFTSGNTTLTGTGSYQFDRLNVPAAKTLSHVTPATISVSGDLEVSGVFNHNSNRLILNGALQQEITATTLGLNLYDLQVNNAANGIADGGYGITLNSNLYISHSFDLEDGIIESVASATVKLLDNATVTGGSDTTFVAGSMEKTGNDAIEFPVGSIPDRYRPLSISAPATVSTVVRVTYQPVAYADLVPAETPLQSVSAIEYWDLSRTGSTDLFTATVGWNDAAQSGLTNCNDISMTVWNGTQWGFVPSGTTGLCGGNNAGTLFSSALLPVVGPIAIGFTENVNQNPVQLCAGESITVGANIYAASGVYIDVLEDMNGNDSTVVTILTVYEPLTVTITNNITSLMANAANVTSFQWIDCNNGNAIIPGAAAAGFVPAVNGSYAVIVSANGCSDTSICAIVDELGLAENAMENVLLYPNPVSGEGKLTLSTTEAKSFEIYTMEGRKIAPKSVTLSETSVFIQLPDLQSGTYLLKADQANGQLFVKRFIVN